MSHIEKYFTSKDNLQLYLQVWETEKTSKALVCLVHGLGEHSGRYAHVAAALNDAGYHLAAFDLRGHGKSQGQRGHSPSIDCFNDDIAGFVIQVSQMYPNLPCFIYAHSLGGLLGLNFLISRKPLLKGAIISAPGLRSPLQEQKFKVLLSKWGGLLLPRVNIKSGLDPKGLSHDEELIKAYIGDPLVHDNVTFGLARSMMVGISRVFSRASEIQIPLLVMHGSEDPLVYPQGSQELCKLVSGECTLKIWHGLFHEIHNEPQKNEVIAAMIDWMDSHLSQE